MTEYEVDGHSFLKGMLDAGTAVEMYCSGVEVKEIYNLFNIESQEMPDRSKDVQKLYNSLNTKSKEIANGQLRLGIPVLLKSIDNMLGFPSSKFIGDVDKYFNGLTGIDLVNELLKLGDKLLNFYPGPEIDTPSYNQGIDSMHKVLETATGGVAKILKKNGNGGLGLFNSLVKSIASLTGFDVDKLSEILGCLDNAKKLALKLRISEPEVTSEAQKAIESKI